METDGDQGRRPLEAIRDAVPWRAIRDDAISSHRVPPSRHQPPRPLTGYTSKTKSSLRSKTCSGPHRYVWRALTSTLLSRAPSLDSGPRWRTTGVSIPNGDWRVGGDQSGFFFPSRPLPSRPTGASVWWAKKSGEKRRSPQKAARRCPSDQRASLVKPADDDVSWTPSARNVSVV